MRRVILIVFIILPSLIFSQRRNRYKYELIGGLGFNNSFTAVGGSPDVASHGITGIKDWNWQAARPALMAGIRFKPYKHFAFRGSFSYAQLFGNDAFSSNTIRHDRNINFRSPVLELSGQVEYYPFKESQGGLYRVKYTKGKRKQTPQVYLFAGIGGFWFNPQGQWNGHWYNLRPLSTEGEGLPGGPKPYAPVAISFPVGIGAKYVLSKQLSLGLEISVHYTTTDYIDDVHGVYYNNQIILEDKGSVAAHFANPGLPGWDADPGQERGDAKYNNAFAFIMFNINYKVPAHKRTRSKF